MFSLLLATLFACLPAPVPSANTSPDGGNNEDSGGSGDHTGQGDDTGGEDSGAESDCDCPDGYSPRDDSSACVAESLSSPDTKGAIYEVCAAEAPWTSSGGRLPNGTLSTDEAFLEALDRSAIWACDETSGEAGQDPLEEWIGLRLEFEAPETAYYLVGTAADNRFWHRLDGEEILVDNSGTSTAFQYWWVVAIKLEAGKHEFTFMARNDGAWGSLGAEISGPFAAELIADDAVISGTDYQAHLLWSTRDRLNSWFEYGETSGYSCPAETELVEREDDLLCLRVDVVDCL